MECYNILINQIDRATYKAWEDGFIPTKVFLSRENFDILRGYVELNTKYGAQPPLPAGYFQLKFWAACGQLDVLALETITESDSEQVFLGDEYINFLMEKHLLG